MCAPRARASTSSGWAYSRSIRSRTRRSHARSCRCWASALGVVTCGIVPRPVGCAQRGRQPIEASPVDPGPDGPALVEPALVAADRADRGASLEIKLEEAGAAVRAAVETVGRRRATAKPTHRGGSSNDGRMECARKHVFDFFLAAVLAGGLGPGRGPIRWRRVMGDGASCVCRAGCGSESIPVRKLGRCPTCDPIRALWLPLHTGADLHSCQPAIGH